jgi:hypothetical protein
MDALTQSEQSLRDALATILGAHPRKPADLAYRWAPDFVLQHGVFFAPRPFPPRVPQGAPKQCYGNALVIAATRGLRYFEGYALTPQMDAWQHAWNADASGLIDSTWMNTGLAYLGVEFSLDRADDAIWNRDGCVLEDSDRHRDIYRERWPGETWTLVWPPSPRLDALRSGSRANILSMLLSAREEMNA